MKYKAIIYDIDGTILDTLKMNMYPLLEIIQEELGETWELRDVLPFAAYPGLKVMEELKIKHPEKVYERWVKYVNDYPEGATLFPGFSSVFETFQERGMIQAVVSAKTKKQYALDFVAKDLDKYMTCAILAEDTLEHKPHPELLLACIEKLQLKPEEVIYVGDSSSDYLASQSAHIDFAYAKWGSISEKGIDQPQFIFASPKELLNLLEVN